MSDLKLDFSQTETAPKKEENGFNFVPTENFGEKSMQGGGLNFRDTQTADSMRENGSVGPEVDRELADLDVRFRLGNYVVPSKAKQINEGGQGRIYPCINTENGQSLIAKVYDASSPEMEHILYANNMVKKLKHQNLARIYEEGLSEDKKSYIVIMQRYKPLDEEYLCFENMTSEEEYGKRFVQAVFELSGAIKTLHDHQILHADIKPNNIMYYEANGMKHLVLIDFGSAVVANKKQRADGEFALTNTLNAESNMLTRGYQAPEMLSGSRSFANEKTDAYSFGMTLAHFIAGVFPSSNDQKNATGKQKAYFDKHKNMNKAGLAVLPQTLPEYITVLCKGLLLNTTDVNEANTYRWGDAEVASWVSYAKRGAYDRILQLPYGIPGAMQSQSQPVVASRNEMVISYESDSIVVHSAQEMIDAFLNNWNETVNNLLNSPNWINSFNQIGADIAELLRGASKAMKNDPEAAEEIFAKRIIYPLGSQSVKSKMIFRGKQYATLAQLGDDLYAALHVFLKDENNLTIYDYSQAHAQAKNDAFTRLSFLFKNNYLSQFLKSNSLGFEIDDEDMQRLLQWEKRMNSQNPNDESQKKQDLAQLLIFVHHIRGSATFILGKEAFISYKEFTDYIRKLADSNPKEAFQIANSLKKDGHLGIEFYAWCMAVPDIKKRPTTNW